MSNEAPVAVVSASNGPVSARSAPAPAGQSLAQELASPASVTLALTVGWLLSELLGRARVGNGHKNGGRSGVVPAQLGEPTPRGVLALQVQAKMTQLKPDLDKACVDEACWQGIKPRLKEIIPPRDADADAEQLAILWRRSRKR